MNTKNYYNHNKAIEKVPQLVGVDHSSPEEGCQAPPDGVVASYLHNYSAKGGEWFGTILIQTRCNHPVR